MVASVLGCLLLLAGPAAAQSDPFDPVIDPNAAVTTTTGTTTTGTTTTGTGTTGTGTTSVQPGVGSEALANTGADVSPYLVIAYALVVVGAGALYVAKLHAPRPIQR